MKAKKYKHLSFEDRCVIEEFLNNNYNFTKIANRIGKDRTTVSHEVKKHRFLRTTSNCNNQPCCFESKPIIVKKFVILILMMLPITNIINL